ncbi:MAG: hexose kinase [Anaerolineae bacterium]|nr:hexose kinase [Anaerolineae bacterium]
MASWRLATVTLNGTLDRVLVARGLSLGEIRNVDTVLTQAGGKGLNVARTAYALGANVMATGLIAGHCGQWIRTCLEETGIPNHFVCLPKGESRISTIIVDPVSAQTTVINDLGPQVQADSWPELCCTLARTVDGYPWVALGGSSLPGLPDTVYADLCRNIQTRDQRVCLDTRGQWLREALTTRPYLLKCNQYEAADLLGCPIDSPNDVRLAIQPWLDSGLERIVITLGDQGAVAVEKDQTWFVKAPKVEALCPIGSGDAMMAGLIVALARGDALPVATRYGVALGTANTLILGSGRCDLGVLSKLVNETRIQTY